MNAWNEGHAGPHIEYPVNGAPIRFNEAIVTGRDALTAAGLVPASEHQLILVRGGRTHLIGTDDKLDLRAEVGGQLRGFPSDRSFGFTVNEIGEVWGTGDMDVDELLSIWPAPEGHYWVLERADEPDTILCPGGIVCFEPGGVEHIVSRPHHGPDKVLVTVITTAGTFPAEGANRYRSSEIIADILAMAAKKLDISDSASWIVTVHNRDINPTHSLEQAGLSGEIDLEWGLREGGGGDA
ncbi:MAG TPA: hypothetical protein DDZ81_17510 [Acetobacteraceae bacterium]|jgi:hypothetical protein|nr:hypothetical protein [Acetobacteraceae bacterium]